MKTNKLILLALFCATALQAQTTTAPVQTFIKGDLDIKYNTRTQTDSDGKPKVGALDVYTLNVNVNNSAIFRGTITQTPLIIGGLLSSVQQAGSLKYDMFCDVVNPANPAQTKQVGRISGTVPVDADGVYRYQDGNLAVMVNQIGGARSFDSKFGGLAMGKPPVKAKGLLDSLNISKLVNGQTMTIVVKKYDKMEFKNHVLAAGPVQIYQEVTVNGKMIYDYDRMAWYFKNLTIAYVVDGMQKVDNISGSILWAEPKKGSGQYQFDVRVNEPPPSESAVFASASDESSFFQTDTSIPSLSGTMQYTDTDSGDTTTASTVKIDLVGNKLTKQQAMCLCKLLVFSAIVPMNAD